MHRITRRSGALLALTALAALPLGLPVAAAATAAPSGSSAEEVASGDRTATTAEVRRERSTRAARVEPGTTRGAKVAKLGWWSRSNEQLPETGLAAPPSVPAVAAPKGSYPVTQVAGEAERITAIELRVKGESGSEVRSVRLSLSEAGDPTGSPNAASAGIVACPMTEVFWSEIENGPWGTKPTYDCSLGSVPGARDDEGVWTFDLSSLAADWLSEDREFAPAVVLVGAAAAAGDEAGPADPAADQGASSFQVAFDAGKGLGVVATTGPGSEDSDEEPDTGEEPDTTDGSGGGAGGTGGGAGFGSGDLGGGGLSGSGTDLGPAPDGGDPVALDDAAGADAGVEAAGAPATPTLAPVSSGPLPWHAGLGGRLLLLLPALLLAYLVMVAMGPNAQPVVGGGRRGVSRALDRVAAATPLRFGRKSS